jgi:hypothetical protein
MSIPADVFNFHIMPAACENESLRNKLTNVKNELEESTSMCCGNFELVRSHWAGRAGGGVL